MLIETKNFPTIEVDNILDEEIRGQLSEFESDIIHCMGTLNDENRRLADLGLIGMLNMDKGVLYYSKNNIKTAIVTISFKLPVIEGNVKEDRDAADLLALEKIFVNKWILKNSGKDDYKKLKRLFFACITNISFISIPYCLLNELEACFISMGERARGGVEYKILTPLIKGIECPLCEEYTEVEKDSEIANCIKCGANFTV